MAHLDHPSRFYLADMNKRGNTCTIQRIRCPSIVMAYRSTCWTCQDCKSFFEERHAHDVHIAYTDGGKSETSCHEFTFEGQELDIPLGPYLSTSKPRPEKKKKKKDDNEEDEDGKEDGKKAPRQPAAWSTLKREFEGRRKPVQTLLPNQAYFLQQFANYPWQSRKQTPFSVLCGMGSGKTLMLPLVLSVNPVLVQEEKEKDDKPIPEYIIVCNLTNIGFIRDTIVSVPIMSDKIDRDIWHVMGYNEFARQLAEHPRETRARLHRGVLALDEFHLMRNAHVNMLPTLEALRDHALAGFGFTGTEFVCDVRREKHYLEYLYGLIDMQQLHQLSHQTNAKNKEDKNDDGGDGADATASDDWRTQIDTLGKAMRGRCMYFNPKLDAPELTKGHYPTIVEEVVQIPMEWEQTLHYIINLKSVTDFGAFVLQRATRNSYDSLSRAICNIIPGRKTSPKVEYLAKRVAAESARGEKPIAIKSHYLEKGTDAVADRIRQLCPRDKVVLLTGKTSDVDERDKIIRDYAARKIDELVFSDTASDSVSFPETWTEYIFEPHPSPETEEQTKARVNRFRDKVKIKVTKIVHLIAVFPDTSHQPATEDLKACQALFEQMGGAGSGVDILAWMRAWIRDHPETVDQKLRRRNDVRMREIEEARLRLRRQTGFSR